MNEFLKIKQLGYLREAMNGAVVRQNIIAGNVANVETPGYKAQSVDFEKKLAEAMGQGVTMKKTDNRHLPNFGGGELKIEPDITGTGQPAKLDGNNVNLDRENSKSAMNRLYYDAMAVMFKKQVGEIFISLRIR